MDLCPKELNPISVASGAKVETVVDYPMAATGHLSFARNYNSHGFLAPQTTDTRLFNSMALTWKHNWEERVVSITNTNGTYAYVLTGNGDYRLFQRVNNAWVGRTGMPEKLDTISQGGGWTYTDNQDARHVFDASGVLRQVVYRDNQTITLTYTGDAGLTPIDGFTLNGLTTLPSGLLVRVQDSFQRSLTLRYESSNTQDATDTSAGVYFRLTRVLFPDSTPFDFHYDNVNRLVNAGSSTYAYEVAGWPELLTKIYDENGNLHASFDYLASYDPATNGRAIGSQHWVGTTKVEAGTITLASSTGNGSGLSASKVDITDALGTKRTDQFALANGELKLSSTSQPCLSGCSSAAATNYDANGNVASKTDFNGNVTKYSYDLTRNLETSRTEAYGTPQARTITTQWHATYRLPTLITEPGKTTSFSYDTSGNLLTKTITDTALSKSRTWTYTYSSLGQVLTADGPRTDVSDITTNTYYTSANSIAGNVYSIGDLATVTNALGQVTSITNYDLNGRPLTITDPNGVVTTLTYDPRGRLKTRTVAGTQTTTYDYDGVGQLTKVTLPDTSYLSYTYDTAHRLTDITDNIGNKTHYTLDAMSNRIQEDTKDPSGNILKTRSRIFDALNRLQKDVGGTTPTTQITQYGYDNNGNLKTVTDPLNHVTANGYDALNRLITVTDPANGIATTTYNALDQVTQVKDPRLVATNYTIDALGNVTLTASPDSGSTNKVYDLAGNVTQKTDARGVVSNYTYDALNRVTSITYPASTSENVSFAYDSVANGNKGKGKLTGYSNDGGATLLTYDTFGNVIQQTEMVGSQFYVTAYQYDSANRLAKITYPSGRIVSYVRNTVGQITQVQLQASVGASLQTLISGVTYQPFGPVSSLTFGNGVGTTIQYDKDYRLTRRTTSAIQGIDVSYGYDAAGNITQLTDAVGGTYTKSFGYDLLSRLTTDNNDVGQMQYQYDANGNRTSLTATYPNSTSNVMPIQYGTQSNRMTTLQGSSMGYDAAGNITSYMGGTLNYTYNNANRASVLSSNNGSSIHIIGEYTYNALGRLTQNASDQHYVYLLDGRYLAVNQFASGTPVERTEYVYLDDIPMAQLQDSLNSSGAIVSTVTTYIHTDHLNTPRALTDRIGNVVWRWEGDAFGVAAPQLGLDVDGNYDELALRFPGQISNGGDPFFYNMNRNYDSLTGRYTQSDPIGLQGGLNTYGYVGGNPVTFFDATGLTRADIDSAFGTAREMAPNWQYPSAVNTWSQEGKSGKHSFWDRDIYVDSKYLRCLDDGEAAALLITILHEMAHFNQTWYQFAIDNVRERATGGGSSGAQDVADRLIWEKYVLVARYLKSRNFDKNSCQCRK